MDTLWIYLFELQAMFDLPVFQYMFFSLGNRNFYISSMPPKTLGNQWYCIGFSLFAKFFHVTVSNLLLPSLPNSTLVQDFGKVVSSQI